MRMTVPSSGYVGTDRLLRVQHSFCPRFTLAASTANDLSPPKLVFARLGALIGNTGTAEHLVEGQLLDQLRPCVGGCLELFDVVFAIPFVVKNLAS